ncbi:GGDEF domain-containing protein [Shewanella putrefaciens]|uniref:GGDEF domain-containing protein n=1 Tax=Shewanella putrefaciens TaxID=24 RepID=UPI00285667E9|nr:GGDEF domain-containing protein [Shewanella putrefaciens]MDR6962446.1 diguanylate cyclase (GGDEF)-like protein [Shewanella putrefaciens]
MQSLITTTGAKDDELSAHSAAASQEALQLLNGIRPFSITINGIFAILFVFLSVWPLAFIYTLGLSYHLWLSYCAHSHPKQLPPIIQWSWVVVFSQSLSAVLILGADAGFQYYLLATIPPSFASIFKPLFYKLIQALIIIVFFLICDIWFIDYEPYYLYSDEMISLFRHINVLGACALLAGVSYAYSQIVMSAITALRNVANTDELTGLINRRSLTALIDREAARTLRTHASMSLVLCDIDYFKRINDSYGHAAGDHVLVNVANLLQGVLREYDVVARWGGEEFLLLLPNTDIIEAMKVAERLREIVACSHLSFEEQTIPVTMTLGVAVLGDENWHSTLARADEALYRGKRQGRNCVVQASAP